jgi:predicted  nucleic acid-binding Zn-ribbon protein
MRTLTDKVNTLSTNGATRTDLEKLRNEIVGSFVDRASYEARHAALIDRNSQLENMIRELRKEVEADSQKIHERFESGKQQIEDRLKAEQEKPWNRVYQISGVVAILLAVFEYLAAHFKF